LVAPAAHHVKFLEFALARRSATDWL